MTPRTPPCGTPGPPRPPPPSSPPTPRRCHHVLRLALHAQAHARVLRSTKSAYEYLRPLRRGSGRPGASLSWEGVSPDPALTPSLSLYGSPGIPGPSPRPRPPRRPRTQATRTAPRVPRRPTAPSPPRRPRAPPRARPLRDSYFSGAQDAPFTQFPDDEPGPSDWRSITGATVCLEGWEEGDLRQVWPASSTPMASPGLGASSDAWAWRRRAPSRRSRGRSLRPTSSRSARPAGRSRRGSSSRGPPPPGPPLGLALRSAPTGAAPTPSPGATSRPARRWRRPASPRDARHAERRRWRRREQPQEEQPRQEGQQEREEAREWRGRGSGWRRSPRRPRCSHSLVHMDRAEEHGRWRLGGQSPREGSPGHRFGPHAHESSQDDDEDDDDEEHEAKCASRQCESEFELFELRAQPLAATVCGAVTAAPSVNTAVSVTARAWPSPSASLAVPGQARHRPRVPASQRNVQSKAPRKALQYGNCAINHFLHAPADADGRETVGYLPGIVRR
nr:serine/arginine repetitive matrix protein 1-like [Penaeus vannamei]